MSVRFVVSAIGKEIQPQIQAFISANASAASQLTSSDSDKGAEDLANAIAYGVAKALTSSGFVAAMSAGVCPPAGGPFGSLISTALSGAALEL